MSADAALERGLREFVYEEARLIDEKRLDEWYELFTEDAIYWMPLARGQKPDELHNSLYYEDKLLLKVRIERLKRPAAYSQHQPSFCQHVLQAPRVESSSVSERRHVLRTPFVYFETQRDTQFTLAGVAYHHLTDESGRLRIRMKQIELLNRDAALPSIQMFL